MTIRNLADLIRATNHYDESDLRRSLYRYTNCGIYPTFSDNGITLLGYVENDSDYCGPEVTLEYPFTLEEYETTVSELDTRACRIWDILHDDTLSDSEKDIIYDL